MATVPPPPTSASTRPAKSLDHVLGQNEHVEGLVAASAEDLATVNLALKQELAQGNTGPGMESAIEKSEAVEEKVLEASEKLSDVNEALKDEVRERSDLEAELAAVKEQGQADHHASLHDLLTGLPNRALFNDRLEHGLAQALRHGWLLAVMFLDLDDFKTINDSYGHDAGDTVLRTVADRLRDITRHDDTVSRHGGDEFTYLLMEVKHERDVALIAGKLIEAIRMPCHLEVGGHRISPCLQASVGISLFPRHGTTAEALIHRADAAMYEAKRNKAGFSFAKLASGYLEPSTS
ncbi:MAG: GGDEF domain-containing protein [Geothrix sp.]|uniref:GGDEF domain-containing protein n=1 Tax=Geothrix sp. TaxID=1962974 RepID=UPI0017EB0134|nr:GGDEF domain-containing protein [Geothrix sp.]NWJ40348.1 GGDEF domain-containing protein [Geothrix sp.]WIL21646.1 MAG: GGDEF domain-containing protein [Geothrix sp.]